jgi:hypothetical protein
MDSADRHADLEVLADEIQLRLVAFESGNAPAATLYFQGFMDLAGQSEWDALGVAQLAVGGVE